MKKFIYIASIVALGLASCSDEFEPNSGQSGVQGISTAYVNVPNVGGVSTRTSLDGLNYYWSNGDAIGVYAANTATGGNVVNSPFVYSKVGSDGTAEFAGQLYLKEDAQYYAYYPYSGSQELDGTNLTMVINPNQSFNAMACEPVASADYSWDYSNGTYGSFANNTAPMAAVSTATSTTEIAFDDMQALGAYIIMPVTGYTSTPIQTATLTIQGGENGTTDQVIAGSFTVDLTDISAAYKVDALENDENEGKQIALNMGAGLDLVPGYITNLWFVVPAGISVKTVSVVFDDDTEHPISRTFNNTNTTEANQPVFVPQAKNTPFEYVQGDGALIATPAQFLEYANLVTMGYPAVQEYKALNITAENSPYADYAEYAQLPQMITLAEGITSIADVESASDYTVKDALIVADLEFSGLAAILKEDLGALGSGVFANPEAQYFLDVYGGYLDATNPGIKPIGGQATYVIQGSGYSINNLTVVGNGMFNRNSTGYTAKINNLNIEGLTVNASQVTAANNNYYLLAQNYNTGQNADPTFSDVTVSESTITTPNPTTDNKAIFNTVWASNFNPSTLAVENNSIETIPAFANNLMLNQNFDFTAEGYGIDNFNTITVYAQAPANPVCTVADQTNAVKLMDKVLNPSNFGYSVVDATTSYWTGTITKDGTGMYAEDLAWVVQNESSGQTFTFGTYDLNLMGTYTNTEGKEVHQYWWAMGNNTANSGFTKTVNGSKTNFTISNVYINGTTDGTTTAANKNNFTLIGRGSIVNNVVVDGITIENVGENANPDALIAAISILPTDGTNIVTVNNMTVNASVASNSAVGGLYVQLQQNWFGRINEATFTWATNGTPSAPLSYGSVAGTAQLQVSGGSTADKIGSVIPSTTTTLDAPKPYFGSASVVISSNSNNAQTVYVDLSALDIAQPEKGSNKLGNITITPGSGLSDGATVNVLSSENVYYQFTYYTSTNTLSYVGNLGAN